MKIRLTEVTSDMTLEAMVEDYPQEGESREVFEERMVRLAARLVRATYIMQQEEEGDDECRIS